MRIFPKSGKGNILRQGYISLFVTIELGLLTGGFYLWRRMSRETGFRYWVKEDYPTIYKHYYSALETMGYSGLEEMRAQERQFEVTQGRTT